MINQAQKIDRRASVSEKYFRHFTEKTFSAESNITPDPRQFRTARLINVTLSSSETTHRD